MSVKMRQIDIEWELGSDGDWTLYLIVEDEFAGAVEIFMTEKPYLENLEVKPEFRRQGWATRFYEQIFKEARLRGFRELRSSQFRAGGEESVGSQQLWEKLQKRNPFIRFSHEEERFVVRV
jgi:GNAT superfamily N-acetyltransferase